MFDVLVHKWLQIPHSLYVHTSHRVKKPRATVLFIHGIGNSGEAWEKVSGRLPADVRIVTIDLLGFGASPKPRWGVYNIHRQARSVMMTYIRLRLTGRVIIVGHSLGALVAIEIAKRYPRLVSALILCSPPFFRPDPLTTSLIPSTEKVRKDIYRALQKYPEQFVKISALAAKYGIINKSFKVTDEDVHSYMSALEASILNQTSLADAEKLSLPMYILYGTLDPVIITRHIKALGRNKDSVTVKSVVIGHEVRRQYITAVVKTITETIDSQSPPSKE
jgi:pimeloyl-ACP methyl ester carboxylesterase